MEARGCYYTLTDIYNEPKHFITTLDLVSYIRRKKESGEWGGSARYSVYYGRVLDIEPFEAKANENEKVGRF